MSSPYKQHTRLQPLKRTRYDSHLNKDNEDDDEDIVGLEEEEEQEEQEQEQDIDSDFETFEEEDEEEDDDEQEEWSRRALEASELLTAETLQDLVLNKYQIINTDTNTSNGKSGGVTKHHQKANHSARRKRSLLLLGSSHAAQTAARSRQAKTVADLQCTAFETLASWARKRIDNLTKQVKRGRRAVQNQVPWHVFDAQFKRCCSVSEISDEKEDKKQEQEEQGRVYKKHLVHLPFSPSPYIYVRCNACLQYLASDTVRPDMLPGTNHVQMVFFHKECRPSVLTAKLSMH